MFPKKITKERLDNLDKMMINTAQVSIVFLLVFASYLFQYEGKVLYGFFALITFLFLGLSIILILSSKYREQYIDYCFLRRRYAWSFFKIGLFCVVVFLFLNAIELMHAQEIPWPVNEFVQQVQAQNPWLSLIALLGLLVNFL